MATRDRGTPALDQGEEALLAAAPRLALGRFQALCRRSHDALDAVVAALTARAVALNMLSTPESGHADRAALEGWIAVPTSPLQHLEP